MTTRRFLSPLILLACSLALVPNVEAFVTTGPATSTTTRAGAIAKTTTAPPFSRTNMNTARYGFFSQNSDLEGSDKLKACVPYILPILDGDHFGTFIYDRLPPIGLLHDVLLGGLLHIYEIFPFMGLVLFVSLTLGTRGNTEMSRNVRFSAQQAALIDVSLIGPELIANAFEGEDMPRALMEPCSNFVWYYLVAMVLYCISTNLRGKKPDQIPYISGWSEFMVGPF